MIRKILVAILLFSIFSVSFGDLYSPVERLMYIYRDGIKVEKKGKIYLKAIGYSYFPWQEASKQDTTPREMDILNLPYESFGSKNYEIFYANYLVIDSYKIVGDFDDGSEFSYPIKEYKENCTPLKQFEISTFDQNGEKYYKAKKGYQSCLKKNNYNDDACKDYLYEVKPDTFKKNPKGDLLDSVCKFSFDIPEKYWTSKAKQKSKKNIFHMFLDSLHALWK